MKAVIFAGGIGTRLWPLSRKKSPKQFEKIVGDKSTLQMAAERLQPDFSWEDLFVSTGIKYAQLVSDQLPHVPPNQIVGEPVMRDVGPAVGLVTALLRKTSPMEPMVILWSDHLIKKEALFRKILMTAGDVVSQKPDTIVFITQKARFASDNLGWIEYGKPVITKNGIPFHSFVDIQYRPDIKTAERYFVTTPAFLWKQYQAYAPNLASGLARIADAWHTDRYNEVLLEVYPKLEKINFDNAILEKLNPANGLVINDDIQWSDIGAWEALKEALETSDDKNVTQGEVMLQDTEDSLVYNYGKQLVVTIDCKEMLVVNTDDVLLVCKKTSVPKVKKLVESLAGSKHEHLT